MIRLVIKPWFRVLLLLAILFCMGFAVKEGSYIKQRIGNIVFDSYVRILPREGTDAVRFVDIDDRSLSEIGQWPWPRKALAEIVDNIAASGARVIVFDGVLAEPDRTSPESIIPLLEEDSPVRAALAGQESHDRLLAEAIGRAGNFVTGFSYGSNAQPPFVRQGILIKKEIREFFLGQRGPGSLYFEGTAQFLPALQKQAAGNGSFMASAEADSVIRRTGMIFHDGKEMYPSLVLEAVRVFEGGGRSFIRIVENPDYSNLAIDEPFRAEIGRYHAPLDPQGKAWVYYRAFDREREIIPAHRFMDRRIAQEGRPDLAGKAVFIASSAEGLMDLRATPVGMKPGVYIHMNAFEQVLQGKFLIRPYAANVLELGFAVLVCLVLTGLSFFIGPLWLALVTAVSTGGMFWGSWHLFKTGGGLLDPVTPSILMILMFLCTTLLSFLKAEYERRQVRSAFGLYISPDFMKELTKDPGKLRLGGQTRELTVIFTDIRGFTSICEGLEPEEITQMMNDFLTPLSDLVMQNRGTIDKYMGDAMMAFWNAPLDDPDHVRHACRAALAMRAALAPVNGALRKRAEAQGRKPAVLEAGIGINTGPCSVGNMGSRQRFAYSALGDAVNLASRLEGQTKVYGVDILIGGGTARQARADGFAMLEADLLKVKGKARPERVHILLGGPDVAQSEAFVELSALHDTMIESYRSGSFLKAMEALEVCRGRDFPGLAAFYALYEARLKALLESPPGETWDGVFEAREK